jgi:uncharacterized protein (TIGR02246 family)
MGFEDRRPAQKECTLMRRILLLFLPPLLTVAFAGLVQGQGTDQNDSAAAEGIKKEIMKVEEERNQAMLHKDTAVLARMYDDDIAWTNPSGENLDKAQVLADLKTGRQKFFNIQHDQIHMTVYGSDVVVVTGRSTSFLQYKEKVSRNIERRFMNVYQKQDGQWKLIVHHQTPVVAP